MADITIDRLLNLVPDSPDKVLNHLTARPDLACKADAHGYSLLHAAASYAQLPLLRALVNDYKADVNITDEDGETPLFVAETVEVAQCLVEELGVDISIRNDEGETARGKLELEGENEDVLDYLQRQKRKTSDQGEGSEASVPQEAGNTNSNDEEVHAPPPLPPNVKIDIGSITSAEEGEAPDPEFRRRIDELAARDDFQSEEGQNELRNLVTEAISGLKVDGDDGRSSSRRRVE
ncbi:hypothetical protein LTS18_009061 [Coniosporium uncinatum]|uniref:Uncharacterized protein n=1 Tax=Coniosporium uncinatum TaxID=93489 RepID=A0ACC3DMQ1_9PEZI|nr:hypothetical protein LTS18_009061 [Coniosporium uncinatum]